MSRSGYSNDWGYDDDNYCYLYRATVDRSLAGKRGQRFLKELAAALDAMPEKKLIADELINAEGECCAIGVVCKTRNIDVTKIDEYDAEEVGKLVGISRSMAAEIEFENDEHVRNENPEDRWIRMRKWVGEQLR